MHVITMAIKKAVEGTETKPLIIKIDTLGLGELYSICCGNKVKVLGWVTRMESLSKILSYHAVV